MYGMNVNTGSRLDGMAHIQQSIADILTTPIGSRVMRRDYGSHVFDLIDQPGNPINRLRLIATSADALSRWEPRLHLTQITTEVNFDGQAVLNVMGEVNDEVFTASVIIGGAV